MPWPLNAWPSRSLATRAFRIEKSQGWNTLLPRPPTIAANTSIS